mmetsp:Transcript_82167/g.229033  ORF Transcript_82167/g.229033 Transcript_82167/m.229033 type:complete len:212 (-) Transcript_82167:825-1460(-)
MTTDVRSSRMPTSGSSNTAGSCPRGCGSGCGATARSCTSPGESGWTALSNSRGTTPSRHVSATAPGPRTSAKRMRGTIERPVALRIGSAVPRTSARPPRRNLRACAELQRGSATRRRPAAHHEPSRDLTRFAVRGRLQLIHRPHPRASRRALACRHQGRLGRAAQSARAIYGRDPLPGQRARIRGKATTCSSMCLRSAPRAFLPGRGWCCV